MKTSDKELDNLFHSKLNNLETEPDAAVWINIEAQLNVKPKKKNITFALRIAASVIVVLSVGLLLLRPNQQLVKKPLPQKTVKLKVQHGQPVINPSEILAEKKMLLLATKNKGIKEAQAFRKYSRKTILKPLLNPSLQKHSMQTLAQVKTKPARSFDSVNDQSLLNKIAVVPVVTTKLSVLPEEETTETIAVKPLVPTIKTSKPTLIAKLKGIRNTGDLVNLVLAEVDKRNDKLIEFSDSDDGDESNVSGINLGIISIKKEK